MAKQQGSTLQGIVLKRSNVGEADRVVTLYTPDQGKMVCIAKGARKISSSKRGVLEPGNHVKVFLIPTVSLPILTQATLITDLGSAWQDLAHLRRISQVLEITDALMVENDADPQLFVHILKLLHRIIQNQISDHAVRQELDMVLQHLGYASITTTDHQSLSDYIAEITERKLRSFEFLKV